MYIWQCLDEENTLLLRRVEEMSHSERSREHMNKETELMRIVSCDACDPNTMTMLVMIIEDDNNDDDDDSYDNII